MAAIAHVRSTAAMPAPRARRNGLHTTVLTMILTLIGALVISALMALSVTMAGPLPAPYSWPDDVRLQQPAAQPSAAPG